LPDEPVEYVQPPIELEDWLAGLRGNDSGQRCRLVLESSGLVRERRWRYDRLLPHWLAHLAAHLEERSSSTIILSKAGQATLRPLQKDQAQRWWAEWMQAWQQALCRPLPLTVDTAIAWLRFAAPDKGGAVTDAMLARAAEEARKCHETECERNPYLARAFPTFEAFAGDDFAHWAEVLLRPLRDHVGAAPKEEGD
jgi:exodeoxyribonuclease V gamma subunit